MAFNSRRVAASWSPISRGPNHRENQSTPRLLICVFHLIHRPSLLSSATMMNMQRIPKNHSPSDWQAICDEAILLLQSLIRIDTSNPPGNEKPAAELLKASLEEDGLACKLIEGSP